MNVVLSPEADALDRVVTLDLRGVNAMDAFATILRMTGTRAEVRRNILWILPEKSE